MFQVIVLHSESLVKLEICFEMYDDDDDDWDLKDLEGFSSMINLEVLKLGGGGLVNDEFLSIIGNYCTKLREVRLEGRGFIVFSF